MEAAVSCSMGAMGPVLRKLDLLLASESRLRKRVKDGIGLLKQDLEEVGSALVDLSMLETPSLRAKCWMEEARELSYHIEDFVDDLTPIRRDAGAKIRSVSSHRVGRVKIALLPAPPRRSTRVAKVAQLRDLLWQASERLERYQLDACCSSPNHMNMITQHHRAPALYGDAANLVGIEDSRTKLIEMLTGEAEQQLKVVSIVGTAGVGKTTLAKEIFRELRGLFDLQVFVHGSRKLDMRRLLGSILSQVQPHHQLPSVAGTVQSLIDTIQEQLRDKRYLIVIDDLWEETAWDIVRGAFPEGNNCSRIVATTENMSVALKCCSYMTDNILKMKPLGIQDSGCLFFNRVFGSDQQCPDELKEVSYGIIRKCCGLPLSVIHVAGLLASIDYSELWYHVHDRLCSILNRSHTVEEIQKKILNLSYNSLPHCLKTCLLYFNMYPEGYIMWKVHLVKQWIAEGFINAAEGKDREEIAEGYFEELVNRGMVQPLKIDYNDEVLLCTVHHVIFDLINHNSKEEEFIAAIDYSHPITGLSTKAHRLSFRLSSAKYSKQPARITMSQLRSLGFFGFIKCMPPIVEFKHLRVLVLDFWGSHDGHRSLNLSRICILFQLRYLKISGDIMVELPAQMQRLHYLETLEIDARLSAVPLDIVHLPSLLHLGLRAATKLPDGIGHIKSLSTLLYFDLRCNSEDNIRSLGQLTNLRHLHLTCSAVLSSDQLKRKLIPLAFSLGKLGNLKSLTLTPDALRTAILFDISSSISSPSMFLRRLELLPPICFFSRLPTRFGELHKLRILKIVVKELHGNDISNISGLPSLTVFSLYVRRALTGTVVFCTMAFRALKYFKFTCGVMCLAFQAGAMPNLQRVKLCFNAHRGKSHNRVLDGIEHLLNLQEVVGRIGVLPGADESDWRVVKLSFEDIIRKHPRCPRFNSQPVDFIEEEYPPLDKFHLRRHEGSSSEHEIVEKACAKDMDKHIDSRLSREFNLPPASGTSYHHKSDEYSEHHMLVSILRDESAEPTTLDLSLFEDITNNFSTEQEVDQGNPWRWNYCHEKTMCGLRGTVDLAYIFHCLMTVKYSNIVRFLGYWEPQPNAIKKWGSVVGIKQQDMLLCFEYLHNGSLRRHITEESCGFEWHTCYQIIKGICQGLDYLHKNSVIHLHLKPENILLDANMVPKIVDYAYARLFGEDRPTATQEIVTLLDYMAQEYHEDGAISLKSDIYSLGVIIMQMVAGHKGHPNIKNVLGGWRSRLESDTSWRHTALETAYRQVILCIEMGKSCMHSDPSKRPCIRDIIDRFAEMETSEASVTSGTSSVSKFKYFSLPFSPKKLFRRSGKESEASLRTPPPTSGQDSLNHHQKIKKSTVEEKVVLNMGLQGDKAWGKIMKTATRCEGVSSIAREEDNLVVVGSFDPVCLVNELRKLKFDAAIVSVGPSNSKKKVGEVKAMEQDKKQDGKEERLDPLPLAPYPPPALSRKSSVLDRLRSFGLYLFRSGDVLRPGLSEPALPLEAAPVEELSSYEAACRSDPELRTFDTTLQRRTCHAISTLAVGVEVRSMSLDALREVTGCLLNMNQEVVRVILDFWKSPELFDLVEDYFESSLQTLDLCTALDKCLKRAHDSQLLLHVALQRFDDEEDSAAAPSARYSRTLHELRQFKAAGDPFTDEFFAAFQAVYRQQLAMLEKLQQRNHRLDKKVRTIKAWRQVSSIIFATTFAAMLICLVVAAAIAAPPVAAALAAAAAVPLGSMGKWIDSLLKGYQDALRGQEEVVSAMQVGTFIAIKDLDSIRVLINRVEVEISSMVDCIEFTERDEEAVKFGVEEIKKMLENFMKSVEDLGEQADRCSRDIRRARTIVLQRIIRHSN